MKLTKIIILIAICVGWGLAFTTEKHKVHKKSKFLNKKKKQSPNGQIFNEQSSLAQNTNIMDMVPDPDTSVIDLNIGPGPIYFKSWVKYFKYASDEYTGTKPRSFFKNMEFYQQARKYPNTDLNKQQDGVNLYIKNEMYFYMLVFYDRVQILTSRVEKFQKTVESLTFDLITPVVEEKDFAGGVTDFGAFAEGFCFKLQSSKMLLTQLPTNQPLTSWIICADTAKEKLDLMTIIRKIKVKRQREQGIIITSEVPPVPPSIGTDLNAGRTPDLKSQSGNLGVTFNSTTSNITDGYWIVLQDWSQCSLKCGGGVSTLQRMCVPPKNGGNSCDGPAILTKPCNIQPCPQVKSLAEKNKTQEAAPKKPIIKMMPFTDRPQRYTKCIVKESDLLFTKIFDEKDKARLKTSYVENLQMPARVVMNNRTVSVFQSTEYTTLLISFDLKDTTLAPSKNHKNCFVLTEGNPNNLVRQAELCPFGLDRVEMVFQEWAYDFNLFKFQCHADRETIDLDAAEARALDDKYKKKVEQANIDLVEEKSKLIQDKLKKNNDMTVQIQKTNQLSMQAIQKELTLEDMIKREEEEREKEAEREMLQEIDNEKHKHDCLVKAIKEKELEDQYNLKTQAAEQQLKKIKDEAIKEVKIKRSELKSAVLKMRKRAERKKAILAQQLQAVRYQMANDMNNLYKDGDMEKCRVAMQNQQNRDTYCGINFPDDYVKFNNCKTEDDDFCTLCCETEYGNLHMDKRQQCIDTLCKPAPPVTENGRWVWTGDSHELIATNQLPPANPPPATPSPSFH